MATNRDAAVSSVELVCFLCLALPVSTGLAAPVIEPRPERSVHVQRFAHYTDWHTKCAQGDACDSWTQASTIPFRRDNLPGVGYASLDPAIIRQHNRELWNNDIVPLISWWGPGAPQGGDGFLDAYLAQWDPCYPVKPGLLYEVVGRLKIVNGVVDFNDPDNADRFIADLRYLQERYWSRYPSMFFHFHGRPVLFIWISEIFRGPFDQVLAQARREVSFSVIGSEFSIPPCFRPGIEQVVCGLDAVSHYGIYAPPLARIHGGHIDAAYVSEYAESVRAWSSWLAENAPATRLILPLQFAFDDHRVPGRNNPRLTSTPQEAQLLADTARVLIEESLANAGNVAPFVLLVSYNEHFEGSAIEPSERYGSDFLDIYRNTFAAPLIRSPEFP